MLEALDIELAAEFLVMAATLMEIKSRMLLPRPPVLVEEEEEEEDPRAELVRRFSNISSSNQPRRSCTGAWMSKRACWHARTSCRN